VEICAFAVMTFLFAAGNLYALYKG
jgi:hypothetical protein